MMTEAHAPEALAPTRIRQKSTTVTSKAHWTPEEDQKLLQFLRSGDRANWTELVPHFQGKTAQQISERWSKVVDPALVKGSWTRQEDETIIEFVAQFGTRNWTKLAELLPGRIGKQCRERWRNHLDPGNSKEPWTPEEDEQLIQLHEQFGNQWVKIAAMMPGRSDNHIKNRWNSTLKKRTGAAAAQISWSHQTPQKRGKRKVETPQSADQNVPKPNFEALTKVEPGLSIPSFGFTPQLDIASPALGGERSPFFFGSPYMAMRATPFSPFGGDMMRTPLRDQFLASPTLSRVLDMERHNAMLDSIDLNKE